jgi:hypothetical protein
VSDEKEAEPTGPMGLKWAYLRPYGSEARYSLDLYQGYHGADTLTFVTEAEGVPEYADGCTGHSVDFDREELDKMIAELTWLRDNWGKVGRGE